MLVTLGLCNNMLFFLVFSNEDELLRFFELILLKCCSDNKAVLSLAGVVELSSGQLLVV